MVATRGPKKCRLRKSQEDVSETQASEGNFWGEQGVYQCLLSQCFTLDYTLSQCILTLRLQRRMPLQPARFQGNFPLLKPEQFSGLWGRRILNNCNRLRGAGHAGFRDLECLDGWILYGTAFLSFIIYLFTCVSTI